MCIYIYLCIYLYIDPISTSTSTSALHQHLPLHLPPHEVHMSIKTPSRLSQGSLRAPHVCIYGCIYMYIYMCMYIDLQTHPHMSTSTHKYTLIYT
jgi:hypothetical protein